MQIELVEVIHRIKINTNMVVEIYSFNSGFRVIDKFEYADQTALDKDLVLRKLCGTLVGYRQYDISLNEFNKLTPTQRNNLQCKAVFDKAAYIGAGK
jgi:hypothetical protein